MIGLDSQGRRTMLESTAYDPCTYEREAFAELDGRLKRQICCDEVQTRTEGVDYQWQLYVSG